VQVRLLIKQGPDQGREVPLPETMFLIGRGPECHLRPHCSAVSTRHCAIAIWAGKVRVRDLQSRNGTRLNGHLIDGEAAASDGDVLRVGTVEFEFRILAEAGDIVPAPVPDEREIDWLLSAPSDSSVLSPSHLTGVLELEAEGAAPASTAGAVSASASASSEPLTKTPAPRRMATVSAGQYFRDYFARRRSR
jgi:pSer/pThr/pTyr-binding forkhead associated (FHA) protein